ncbi:LLM class flavin-dependent oxidoreductase [Streptomyces monticola]|uniref:LLM class flavin-dependent oxidoreductase n=1 Tax=Streptomyces monticola TaxID=2666263 RepID=A0ABW2JC77_9ACTN
MTALGAVFRPQLPPERLKSVARAAEEAGLEELWLWEDCFFEGGIAAQAAALAWTERLRVGVGLLPVPLRNVALTAMEAATLYRLFPGRAELAVGHGVQSWMAQTGSRVESPVTLLREHLDALRALLRGERVTCTGRYVRLDDVALDWPPATAPVISAGGRGPRTLRLSGEAADGTVLDADTPLEEVRRARVLVDEGRAAADRTDPHKLTVYLAVDGHAAILDPATVAKSVRETADAGAHTVVLQPDADEPDPEGFVRRVAQEVRPLVP